MSAAACALGRAAAGRGGDIGGFPREFHDLECLWSCRVGEIEPDHGPWRKRAQFSPGITVSRINANFALKGADGEAWCHYRRGRRCPRYRSRARSSDAGFPALRQASTRARCQETACTKGPRRRSGRRDGRWQECNARRIIGAHGIEIRPEQERRPARNRDPELAPARRARERLPIGPPNPDLLPGGIAARCHVAERLVGQSHLIAPGSPRR